jgi:hypothetical protein
MTQSAIKDLEQELADRLSKEIADEIDREVLWGMLIDMGWHRVSISRLQDNIHAVDITFWLEDNIKNPYQRDGRNFLFAAERDATLFILRWV